jgi:hypothetical protein
MGQPTVDSLARIGNEETQNSSLGVPELYDKSLDAVSFAFDDQLSEHRTVCRGGCGACQPKKKKPPVPSIVDISAIRLQRHILGPTVSAKPPPH